MVVWSIRPRTSLFLVLHGVESYFRAFSGPFLGNAATPKGSRENQPVPAWIERIQGRKAVLVKILVVEKLRVQVVLELVGPEVIRDPGFSGLTSNAPSGRGCFLLFFKGFEAVEVLRSIKRGGVQWVMPREEFWPAALSAQKNWAVAACLRGSAASPPGLPLQSQGPLL